jgi:hypothetical protein
LFFWGKGKLSEESISLSPDPNPFQRLLIMGEIRIRVLPRESIGQGVLLLKKKKPHGAARANTDKKF